MPGAYFYPRSHVGNDFGLEIDDLRLYKFLSTFPRRERLYCGVNYGLIPLFLSTFPRRERLNILGGENMSNKFLSTFPRRERPPTFSDIAYAKSNFYPRSHVGNDSGAIKLQLTYDISIHVPT